VTTMDYLYHCGQALVLAGGIAFLLALGASLTDPPASSHHDARPVPRVLFNPRK